MEPKNDQQYPTCCICNLRLPSLSGSRYVKETTNRELYDYITSKVNCQVDELGYLLCNKCRMTYNHKR